MSKKLKAPTARHDIKFLMDYIYGNIGMIYRFMEIEQDEDYCRLLPGMFNRMAFLDIRKRWKIKGKYCLGGKK